MRNEHKQNMKQIIQTRLEHEDDGLKLKFYKLIN
jgi:hypothetical protein